jgi:hypothetical protein
MFELELGLGLAALAAEELADCLECSLPCGRQRNPDAPRKQRDRLADDLQKRFDRNSTWVQVRSGEPLGTTVIE